jgi:hypothetical protein
MMAASPSSAPGQPARAEAGTCSDTAGRPRTRWRGTTGADFGGRRGKTGDKPPRLLKWRMAADELCRG